MPENDSTGGKVKQKGLSKKGDRYLRSLLINGAMAVVRYAQIGPDKHPWVTKLLGCMSKKQAAVAIADKTARIAWAIMVHGGVHTGPNSLGARPPVDGQAQDPAARYRRRKRVDTVCIRGHNVVSQELVIVGLYSKKCGAAEGLKKRQKCPRRDSNPHGREAAAT